MCCLSLCAGTSGSLPWGPGGNDFEPQLQRCLPCPRKYNSLGALTGKPHIFPQPREAKPPARGDTAVEHVSCLPLQRSLAPPCSSLNPMRKEDSFILSKPHSRRSLPPLTGKQISIWGRGHLSNSASAVDRHLLRCKSCLWNCGLLWVGEVSGGQPPAPGTPHTSGGLLHQWAGMLGFLICLPGNTVSPSSAIKMSDCISHSRAGLLLPGRGRTREPLEREENHMLFLKAF